MIMMVVGWIFSLLLGTSSSIYHDFHLSKAEVNYNVANQSLEVSVHLFIDDLEAAITAQTQEQLFFATSQEHPKADSLIEDYIENHFIIEVDGEAVNFEFIGKEESNDLLAFWCYLEATSIVKPRNITFKNHLLTELFDDQKNLIAFTAPDVRQFYMLDKDKHETNIKIDQ